MEEHTLENGHTVRVGAVYTMNYENEMLGIPTGTKMSVINIAQYPDGFHIEFTCKFPEDREPLSDFEGDPTTIYAFAMNELLNDGDMLA
jgi:hypothetical protein